MTSSLLEIGKPIGGQSDCYMSWMKVQAFTATVLKRVFLNNLNAAKAYLIIKNWFFVFWVTVITVTCYFFSSSRTYLQFVNRSCVHCLCLFFFFLDPGSEGFTSSLHARWAVSVALEGCHWPTTERCSCPCCGCLLLRAFCPALLSWTAPPWGSSLCASEG